MIIHHSKRMYCLITMRSVVLGGSLLSLTAFSYIFVPVFLSVILLVRLLLCFLYRFGPLCHPRCLGILYMRCCFSVYTRISVPVHFFLFLGVDHMLFTYRDFINGVLKLPVYIVIPSLCMLSRFFFLTGETIVCSNSLSLINILH